MAVTGTALADGQLPSSKGTLYTAAAVTYVKSISCHSTSATSQTVILYTNRGGTSRVIARVPLEQYETLYVELPIVLESGDLLEGVTTTATAVDYQISGGVEA